MGIPFYGKFTGTYARLALKAAGRQAHSYMKKKKNGLNGGFNVATVAEDTTRGLNTNEASIGANLRLNKLDQMKSWQQLFHCRSSTRGF